MVVRDRVKVKVKLRFFNPTNVLELSARACQLIVNTLIC